MTKQDLIILYKRETGKEVVNNIPIDIDCEEISDLEDYLHWLEDELIVGKTQIDNLKTELITLKTNKL